MALKLNVKYKGVDCDYWKIISSICDYTLSRSRVILGLYQSKEHREGGIENFLERQVIELSLIHI